MQPLGRTYSAPTSEDGKAKANVAIPEQRRPSEPRSDLTAPEPESAWETFLWSRPTTKPRWVLRLVLAPFIWLVGSILGVIDIAREDGWR